MYTIITGVITHFPTLLQAIDSVYISKTAPDDNLRQLLVDSSESYNSKCIVLEYSGFINVGGIAKTQLEHLSPETLNKIVSHNSKFQEVTMEGFRNSLLELNLDQELGSYELESDLGLAQEAKQNLINFLKYALDNKIEVYLTYYSESNVLHGEKIKLQKINNTYLQYAIKPLSHGIIPLFRIESAKYIKCTQQ